MLGTQMLVDTPMELWSFTSHPHDVGDQDVIPSQGTSAPLLLVPSTNIITLRSICAAHCDLLTFVSCMQGWPTQRLQPGLRNKIGRWALCLVHLNPGCTSIGRQNRYNKLRRSPQTCSSPGPGSSTAPHSPASPGYPAHVRPFFSRRVSC